MAPKTAAAPAKNGTTKPENRDRDRKPKVEEAPAHTGPTIKTQISSTAAAPAGKSFLDAVRAGRKPAPEPVKPAPAAAAPAAAAPAPTPAAKPAPAAAPEPTPAPAAPAAAPAPAKPAKEEKKAKPAPEPVPAKEEPVAAPVVEEPVVAKEEPAPAPAPVQVPVVGASFNWATADTDEHLQFTSPQYRATYPPNVKENIALNVKFCAPAEGQTTAAAREILERERAAFEERVRTEDERLKDKSVRLDTREATLAARERAVHTAEETLARERAAFTQQQQQASSQSQSPAAQSASVPSQAPYQQPRVQNYNPGGYAAPEWNPQQGNRGWNNADMGMAGNYPAYNDYGNNYTQRMGGNQGYQGGNPGGYRPQARPGGYDRGMPNQMPPQQAMPGYGRQGGMPGVGAPRGDYGAPQGAPGRYGGGNHGYMQQQQPSQQWQKAASGNAKSGGGAGNGSNAGAAHKKGNKNTTNGNAAIEFTAEVDLHGNLGDIYRQIGNLLNGMPEAQALAAAPGLTGRGGSLLYGDDNAAPRGKNDKNNGSNTHATPMSAASREQQMAMIDQLRHNVLFNNGGLDAYTQLVEQGLADAGGKRARPADAAEGRRENDKGKHLVERAVMQMLAGSARHGAGAAAGSGLTAEEMAIAREFGLDPAPGKSTYTTSQLFNSLLSRGMVPRDLGEEEEEDTLHSLAAYALARGRGEDVTSWAGDLAFQKRVNKLEEDLKAARMAYGKRSAMDEAFLASLGPSIPGDFQNYPFLFPDDAHPTVATEHDNIHDLERRMLPFKAACSSTLQALLDHDEGMAVPGGDEEEAAVAATSGGAADEGEEGEGEAAAGASSSTFALMLFGDSADQRNARELLQQSPLLTNFGYRLSECTAAAVSMMWDTATDNHDDALDLLGDNQAEMAAQYCAWLLRLRQELRGMPLQNLEDIAASFGAGCCPRDPEIIHKALDSLGLMLFLVSKPLPLLEQLCKELNVSLSDAASTDSHVMAEVIAEKLGNLVYPLSGRLSLSQVTFIPRVQVHEHAPNSYTCTVDNASLMGRLSHEVLLSNKFSCCKLKWRAMLVSEKGTLTWSVWHRHAKALSVHMVVRTSEPKKRRNRGGNKGKAGEASNNSNANNNNETESALDELRANSALFLEKEAVAEPGALFSMAEGFPTLTQLLSAPTASQHGHRTYNKQDNRIVFQFSLALADDEGQPIENAGTKKAKNASATAEATGDDEAATETQTQADEEAAAEAHRAAVEQVLEEEAKSRTEVEEAARADRRHVENEACKEEQRQQRAAEERERKALLARVSAPPELVRDVERLTQTALATRQQVSKLAKEKAKSDAEAAKIKEKTAQHEKEFAKLTRSLEAVKAKLRKVEEDTAAAETRTAEKRKRIARHEERKSEQREWSNLKTALGEGTSSAVGGTETGHSALTIGDFGSFLQAGGAPSSSNGHSASAAAATSPYGLGMGGYYGGGAGPSGGGMPPFGAPGLMAMAQPSHAGDGGRGGNGDYAAFGTDPFYGGPAGGVPPAAAPPVFSTQPMAGTGPSPQPSSSQGSRSGQHSQHATPSSVVGPSHGHSHSASGMGIGLGGPVPSSSPSMGGGSPLPNGGPPRAGGSGAPGSGFSMTPSLFSTNPGFYNHQDGSSYFGTSAHHHGGPAGGGGMGDASLAPSHAALGGGGGGFGFTVTAGVNNAPPGLYPATSPLFQSVSAAAGFPGDGAVNNGGGGAGNFSTAPGMMFGASLGGEGGSGHGNPQPFGTSMTWGN